MDKTASHNIPTVDQFVLPTVDQTDLPTVDQIGVPTINTTDIPLENIIELLAQRDVGSFEHKILTVAKFSILKQLMNDKHIISLTKSIGTMWKSNRPEPIQNANTNSTESCDNIDIDDNIDASDNIDVSDNTCADLESYCNEFVRLFVKKTDYLEAYILEIIAFLLDKSNLAKFQSFLDTDTLTIGKHFNSIAENLHTYLILVGDLFDHFKIDNTINVPETIVWQFDNPNNPIEKTINLYLEANSDYETTVVDNYKNMSMTFTMYADFVRQTYNITNVVYDIIESNYLGNLEELLNGQYTKCDTNLTELIPMLVCITFINYPLIVR